jgi:hypothetical protein
MILLTVLEVYGGEIWRGGRGALSKSREERERRGAAGADLSERGGVESALFISGRSNFFVALLVSASPIYRLPWFGWWVGGSGRGGRRRERRRCARCHESSVSFSPLVRCGEERKCRALLGQRNGKGGPLYVDWALLVQTHPIPSWSSDSFFSPVNRLRRAPELATVVMARPRNNFFSTRPGQRSPVSET